jgi:hypothetical protein
MTELAVRFREGPPPTARLAVALQVAEIERHGGRGRLSQMPAILIVVLVLLLLGVVPAWPYSRGWGYYPSGILGVLLLILLVLALTGRL